MGNALINFTQGSTTGGAGFALMGVLSTSVVVSNGDDSNIVNWEFIVDDVGVGSSVPQGTVQDGATSTWSFAPDATGCYVVTLITTDNQGNLYQDTRCFGVLENSGRFIPSYLATDEAMNFVVSSVTNTKGWSPYLQAYLKAVDEAAGGGGGSYTQDCSAGGTIVYDGPSTVPPLVNFTGAPGGGFTFTPPSAAFATMFQNLAGHPATIGGSGYVLQNGDYALFVNPGGGDFCEPATAVNAVGPTAGDILLFNSGRPVQSAVALAGVNTSYAGEEPFVPLYAMLNPKDLSTYGVTPPDMMGDPSTVVVPDGIALGYVNLQGYVVEDVTGESTTLAHSMFYPNASWDTQRAARNLCAPDYGDTLIGPSVTPATPYYMGLPNIGTGSPNATHHVKFVVQCRVVSTSGSTEAEGDMCTIIQECDFTTVGGTMVGVQGGAQVVTFVDQTMGGNVGTVVFNPLQSVSGSQIAPYIQTPAGFDPSTVLDIAIFTESYST